MEQMQLSPIEKFLKWSLRENFSALASVDIALRDNQKSSKSRRSQERIRMRCRYVNHTSQFQVIRIEKTTSPFP